MITTPDPMHMFAQVTEQPIFPTTIWAYDLAPEIAGPMNAQLLKDLNDLTSPRPPLVPGQNWQTEQTLHECPEFAQLVEIFMKASKEVVDKIEIDYEEFEITGCWANMNPKGAFHVAHTHPNNFLSGVYYLQAAAGADSITFHEPRPQIEVIAPRVKRDNRYNSLVTNISVRAGRMVLFPSWLVHSVTQNRSDAIRISVSFNIMFSGFTKTMSRPKWSGIPLKKTAAD